MNPALWISKTGLAAQDAKMTAISNNLANVNTPVLNVTAPCSPICSIRISVRRAAS